MLEFGLTSLQFIKKITYVSRPEYYFYWIKILPDGIDDEDAERNPTDFITKSISDSKSMIEWLDDQLFKIINHSIAFCLIV